MNNAKEFPRAFRGHLISTKHGSYTYCLGVGGTLDLYVYVGIKFLPFLNSLCKIPTNPLASLPTYYD
jgi:hypothetical protein